MKIQALVLLLGTTLAEGSSGFVNLKDGSYQTQLSSPLAMRLEISYSSRRNHTGLFGTGWCSLLDQDIRQGRGQRYEYRDCDRVQRFEPAPTTLLIDSNTHLYQATENGLTSRLEKDPTGFLLESGPKRLRFTSAGELLEILDGPRVIYRRLAVTKVNGETRVRAQLRGQLIDFAVSDANFVTSLEAGSDERLSLSYVGSRLIRAGRASGAGSAASSFAEEFRYDQEGNMTDDAGAGGRPVRIAYDRAADRVRTVEGPGSCPEKFEYQVRAGPKNGPAAVSGEPSTELRTEIADVTEICPQITRLKLRIENDYLVTPESELILIESRRLTRNETRRRRFHPLLGTLESDRREPPTGPEKFLPRARPKTRLATEL